VAGTKTWHKLGSFIRTWRSLWHDNGCPIDELFSCARGRSCTRTCRDFRHFRLSILGHPHPDSNRLAIACGMLAYSTYLFHFLVIVILRSLLKMPKYGDTSLVPPFFAGLCLLVSFALGALAYRWIEKPSDQIGKQL